MYWQTFSFLKRSTGGRADSLRHNPNQLGNDLKNFVVWKIYRASHRRNLRQRLFGLGIGDASYLRTSPRSLVAEICRSRFTEAVVRTLGEWLAEHLDRASTDTNSLFRHEEPGPCRQHRPRNVGKAEI